jgi:hypothetical protein
LTRPELVREPLAAQATITADGDGFRLNLVIEQSQRELQRTVRASACDELANAAALIVALLIDPTLRTTDEPLGDATVPEEPAAERAARPRSRETPSEPSLLPQLRVVAGPVADVGSLPAPAPGLELGAGVELGSIAVTLSGAWFPYSRRSILPASDGQPEKGGTFQLATGLTRVCYRPIERIEFAGCGAIELGVLRGNGYGTASEITSDVFWVALGPGLETGVHVTERVVLRGAGDLLFALRRPNFVLEGVGEVHEPGALSVRLAMGLLLRFP